MSTPNTPLSASDIEALFCVALLNTLKIQQTGEVLAKYLEMRDNPHPTLIAIGRLNMPERLDAQSSTD
jgi:hypothetical protein